MLAVILTAKVLERNPLALFAAGAAALAGHTLSFWVKFKGGKGVASGLGVFIALAPKATLITLLVFLAVLVVSRMVSLGSIIAAAALPFLIYGFQEGGPVYYPYLTGFSAIIATFIIFKHKANIKRILKGEELALGQKKPDETTTNAVSEADEKSGEDQ
jgi:glycerol-3-phosphate acyltransferase PlsY